MGDKHINTNAARESDDASRRLSEQALDPRNTADARDSVTRVADSGDRSQFRQLSGNELDGMRQNLKNASGTMREFNEGVAAGKIKPGTEGYQVALANAEEAYKLAIQQADKRLYEKNPDGSIKIDPATGKPQESDFLKRVGQERTLLNQEIEFLKTAQGRSLTREEMTRLGVQSNNAVEVLRERQQQDIMLQDVQRSAGYARANYGLALIRSAAGASPEQKEQQIARGQQQLEAASMIDPKMFGPPADPNFEKHYKRVVKVSTGKDVELQGTAPGATGDINNARAGQRNGVPVVSDGVFNLPTGKQPADAQDFQAKNPFTILNATDAALKSPMSPENRAGYIAAIQAADGIDRARLVQKMQADQGYIDSVRQTDTGKRILSVEQTIKAKNAEMDTQQQSMATMIPEITAKGGQGAVDFLNKLREFKDVNQLVGFLRAPENAAVVRQFQGLPKGADFLSTLEQFQNNNKIIKDSEAVIAGLDPKYARAQESLKQDKLLYESSLDARAHFVRALVRDPANQSQANQELAQTLIKQIAEIKPSIMQDREFQEWATMLGLKPDGKGGLEVVKPGDATATGTGTLTEATTTSVGRAYDTYAKVMQKQPPSVDAADKQAFEAAIADAAKINPAEVTAQRQALAQQIGLNEFVMDRYLKLGKVAQDAYAQIPAGAAKTQLNGIQDQLNRLTSTDPTANEQRTRLEAQLQSLGSDPKVKAYLDARTAGAKFVAENRDAIKADINMQNLEHAKPLAQGLYGAALQAVAKTPEEKAAARPHLVAAARDQDTLILSPDIARAIQQSGDATIMTEAATAARAADQTGDGAQVGPAAAQTPELYDKAFTALQQSMAALGQVQENGQPLPANLKQVFENAINLNKTVNPQALETMKGELKTKLLPNWTDADEAKYRTINQAVMQTEAGVSPAAKAQIDTLRKSVNPQDANAQAAFEQQVRALGATDPTVKAYFDAVDAAKTYYQQTPAAEARDAYETSLNQIIQLQHGKGIAETYYAAALASTKNPQDLEAAKVLMQSALTDKGLAEVFPQAAVVAQELGMAGGDAAAGGQTPMGPSELDKIPGFKSLREAEAVMMDKALTPQQRIEKAAPLYAKSIEESKSIDIAKLEQQLGVVGARINAIEAEATAAAENPAKMQQLQEEYQQLATAAQGLQNMRLQPLKAHMLQAMAYNGAAAELYDQANKANKPELKGVADGYNAKAVEVLRSLEKVDPKMFRDSPAVAGAIQQAEARTKITPTSASATGQIIGAERQSKMGIFGPGMGRQQSVTLSPDAGLGTNLISGTAQVATRGIQPLWSGMNVSGYALEQAGKVPVVGAIPGMLGAGLQRTDDTRRMTAEAVAMAKANDPAAARQGIDAIKQNMATEMVQMTGNLAGAYGGVMAMRLASDAVASRIPGPGGRLVAKGLIGLGTTTLINGAVDQAGNTFLGTDKRDYGQLAMESGVTFAATWGLQGISGARTMGQQQFLNGQTVTPFRARFMESMVGGGRMVPTAGAGLTDDVVVQGQPLKVTPRFAEQLRLTPGGETGSIAGKLDLKKMATMNPNEQYTHLLRTAGKEASMPSQWINQGRFSTTAYNGATGAGFMGVYSLGEANPLTINPETGKRYTLAETLNRSLSSAAYGGVAGIGAPLVGKSMNFLVAKPLKWTMGYPSKFVFGPGGAEATKLAGFTPKAWQGGITLTPKAPVEGGNVIKEGLKTAYNKAIVPAFTHSEGAQVVRMQMNGLKPAFTFSSDAATTVAKQTLHRAAIGYGGGFTIGAGSSALGGERDFAKLASAGHDFGWKGAAGTVALPIALRGLVGVREGSKWVVNHTAVPLFNKGISPAFTAEMDTQIGKAMLWRGGVGFGGGSIIGAATHNPLVGDYTWGDSGTAALQYGAGGALLLGTTPWSRQIVQKAMDPATKVANAVGNSSAGQFAGDAGSNYIQRMAVPQALVLSDIGSNAYGIVEWGRIEKEADAILAAAKAEEAKKQQQARQPVAPRR